MSAFRTYDIRGIYGSEVDGELALRVGRAFARYGRLARCVVAHDARTHSAELCSRLIEGLRYEGCDVATLGLTSTPHLHHTQRVEGYPGAVMVTASHNPPEYHGFKLFGPEGGSVSRGSGLEEVERIAGVLPPAGARRRGALERIDTLAAYVEFLAGAATTRLAGLPVVIDVSHGSSGAVFAALAKRLGLNATLLNDKPNGSFPSHGPNPLEASSQRQIASEVPRLEAAVGALIDGDGDRIIFVDDEGHPVASPFISALIAEHLLASSPGGAIVHDLISSRVLPERVREAGGRPVACRVGYTFVHRAMVDQDALLGAETSGHLYFRTPDGDITESAAYTLVVVLSLVAAQRRRLSTLLEPLRGRYAQAPEINLKVDDPAEAMRRVEGRHREAIVDRMDGLSVSYPDYWFNVRPSNTEPVLRIRLEARSAEIARVRADELRALIEG